MTTWPLLLCNFKYEYFNIQATGPGPGQVPGPKQKRNQDQSSGTEMTRTGTGPVPGPSSATGPETFSAAYTTINGGFCRSKDSDQRVHENSIVKM